MKPTLPLIAALALATLVSAHAAPEVKVIAGLGRPVLPADEKGTTYLKVALTGFSSTRMERRTPVNVAIVLDRSGSMSGEKIRKAKEAAIMAIDRLNSDDIVSVIAFDDKVQVLVPATKVSDRAGIQAAIERLQPGGSTAIFAGVSKGAAEVRKFLSRERMNRVILLSDGLANVGPSSPGELGELGASLIKERISVTTIGLGDGFNEDLMTQLARQSDGNHGFAENAGDLARIFNAEFGDILSVVAQEVCVKIRCAEGFRPVRVLGRDADITGQQVVVRLNQLYADQEKYVILEVETPATASGRTRQLASVEVTYANMATRNSASHSLSVTASFNASRRMVEEREDRSIMASAIELIGVENNKRALALRDAGKIEEAKSALVGNRDFLTENAARYDAPKLKEYGVSNDAQSKQLDESSWNLNRKSMKKDQYSREAQQSY
ncbi:MAG: hypothetical protein PCFJNLEI_01465 [Verrucomicrobiae bacterium]|nr:hypothetical protein [Verrucomicrobiae bacterium]